MSSMSSWVRFSRTGFINGDQRALSRALLDVPQLPHDVARRPARDRRHRAEAVQVQPVTRAARRRLAPAARDERGAPFQASRRNVGDEAGPRVAKLEPLHVLGRFDDPVADRFGFGAGSGRNTLPARRVRGTVADSRTVIHRVHFIDEKYVAACLISSSVMSVAASIICAVFALRGSALARRPRLEVHQLLHDVGVGLSGDGRVLGTALAVRHVAHRAAAHVRLAAVDDDGGHGRMVVGKPVAGIPVVTNVRQRELLCAAGHVLQRRVRLTRSGAAGILRGGAWTGSDGDTP